MIVEGAGIVVTMAVVFSVDQQQGLACSMKRQKIRPIAICVMRQGDRILVSEGYEPFRQEVYYRPVGGGIDFGESSREAVIQEAWEELEVNIEEPILLGVLENLFVSEGEPKHEIVFVYDAVFCDRTLYAQPVLKGIEGDTPFEARWLSKDQVQTGARLYPSGLQTLLSW